jgi:hypothetical protein
MYVYLFRGKRKIVSSAPNGALGFLFWYKKTVMPKKRNILVQGTLKDCLPNLPLKTRKAKKKIKDFLSRQFCASLIYTYVAIYR